MNKTHADNYLVYNLSGDKYEQKQFIGSVLDYHLKEEEPPSLQTVFLLVKEMINWLDNHKDNVLLMHSNDFRDLNLLIASLLIAV